MARALRNAAIVLLCALLAWPASSDPARGAEPKRPNILIIITDDQRADGASLAMMPKTRRWLARGGRRFTNAYVTTPYCCPSRASIFTGMYAHNHGVTHNMNRNPDIDHRLTVQHQLRANGYRTAYFGKFLNGWNIRRRPPYFHRWAIFSKVNTRTNKAAGYRRGRWNVNGRLRRIRTYSTSYLRRRAVRFLQTSKKDGRPWFMVLATAAPHLPAPPQKKYRRARVPRFKHNPATLEKDRSDKPPFFRERNWRMRKIRRHRRNQLRSLKSVDDMVHTVFKRMGRLGQRRNTLVFFLSDNGFLWGEHARSRKLYPYTMSVKVPFMMRWPGRVKAGTRSGDLVANIDIAPTILHAAGIPQPAPMDGRSLLGGERRDRLLLEFWADAYAPDWASIRTKGLQYIEYYGDDGEVIFREYYDLAKDRWQLRNLLGDGDPGTDPPPDELLTLSARLALDRECRGTEGPTACP